MSEPNSNDNKNNNNENNIENNNTTTFETKPLSLYTSKHLSYLKNLDKTRDKYSIGFFVNEHLKVSALYWGCTSLNLLNDLSSHNKEETISFILKCQNQNGGFGGSIGHDSHITSTHYALLILAQFNSLNLISAEKIALYIKNLQNDDGSFKGDEYAETDSRFSYCAAAILKIINKLNENYINISKATEYVLSCQNFDGGFGSIPGAESHGAYCFTCIGFLSVTNQLNLINKIHTGKWLAERQTHLGGFNGRPEKLPDVCYSWWVLSSMNMIGTMKFFDNELLMKFILECQDEELGGIGDRPGNYHDVFHTFFGLCGLSLMKYNGLKLIDPTWAIPVDNVKNFLKE
jgi:geranylgeranyl transferase type-2 subunit beta